ncbi:hypothetical protein ACQJBY_014624 [Aegilops geniculata]
MNMESDFHMAKGEGETSYVNNSRIQQKALIETEAVLEKAVREVCMDLHQPAMTAVDLGCSSGQNTLLFVSKVIKVVGRDSDEKLRCNPVELQFFLNDLPGNDFNYVFRSLERFKESITARHKGNTLLPPFYIAGLPGSYYTRLFPRQSCHLFHSSYCLHWLSRVPQLCKEHLHSCMSSTWSLIINVSIQVPAGLEGEKEYLNGGNICVEEGLVEKVKLDSFNLPIYAPSVNEVKEVVAQNGLFNISHIKLFESNWDPHDDSEGGEVQNSVQSGINIAKSLRAVFGPLLAKHFGESLLNKLFKNCANYAAQHLERGEGKYLLICVSLKRT